MKKILVGLLFLSSYVGFSQVCEALILNEGTVLTYTQYDKKGKENGSSTHRTTLVESVNDKISATLEMEFKGEKEDENFNTSYKVTCANGVIGIDMVRFFDASSVLNYDGSDFNIEIEGDILEFPNDLNSNAVLNDGAIAVKVISGNIPIVTVKMNITNRKIAGNESITTSAGTFNCTKLSYDYESKIGFLKVRGSAEEWYANDEKVIVKTISYNKKGKEISSSQLTAKK